MMKTTVLIAVFALLTAASAVAGLSSNGATLRAALDAKQQSQLVKASSASGRFAATVDRVSKGRGRLTWQLTYKQLSSRVTNAVIVVPKVGSAPQVVVELCRRCSVSANGVQPTSSLITNALLARPAYVQIRTQKNPKGEIRGRITRSKS